jgi:hypothetical protein
MKRRRKPAFLLTKPRPFGLDADDFTAAMFCIVAQKTTKRLVNRSLEPIIKTCLKVFEDVP